MAEEEEEEAEDEVEVARAVTRMGGPLEVEGAEFAAKGLEVAACFLSEEETDDAFNVASG